MLCLHDGSHRCYLPHLLSRCQSLFVRHLGCPLACLQSCGHGLHLVRSTSMDWWYLRLPYDPLYMEQLARCMFPFKPLHLLLTPFRLKRKDPAAFPMAYLALAQPLLILSRSSCSGRDHFPSYIRQSTKFAICSLLRRTSYQQLELPSSSGLSFVPRALVPSFTRRAPHQALRSHGSWSAVS